MLIHTGEERTELDMPPASGLASSGVQHSNALASASVDQLYCIEGPEVKEYHALTASYTRPDNQDA
jgi:hypothetical protein